MSFFNFIFLIFNLLIKFLFFLKDDSPDERALTVLRNHNLTSDHISRQLKAEDFDRFDFIFGMDEYIVSSLKERKRQIRRKTKAKVKLLGDFYPSGTRQIADPYFDNEDDLTGYESCYRISLKSIISFLDQIMIDSEMVN